MRGMKRKKRFRNSCYSLVVYYMLARLCAALAISIRLFRLETVDDYYARIQRRARENIL